MRKKWILLFLLYTILVFIIFTYLLFPSQMLKRKVERELSQHFPGQVLINDISFNLPVHFKIKGVELTFFEESKEKKPFSMSIEQIKAGIDFFKILQGKLGLKGEILIGNGIIKANINQKVLGAPVRHLSSSVENISIQDFPFLDQQSGMHITGLLKGEITAEWPGKNIVKSDGIWSFRIEKGRIIPKQFPAFNFDSINSNGLIKKQNIQIEKLEVQGEDLSLTATGRIRLASQIQKSFIDTQVGLKLLPKLRKRLGGFASFLPKPDNKGFINLFVSGPPGDLRFSSMKRKK